MEAVPESISFPQKEEEVLKLWKDIDAFQTSLKMSEGRPEYSFYDGPPFATGLPHYGHILAGTIKDTVTRYAHQTGHHVTRRFGWDTHGLPIEFEIDKELGVKTREDVLKMGIPAYNAKCRSIVMKYASEWESVITRLGRWIDFKNDYKTLDLSFMESVWWVFSELFKKELVYQGFKVMPYSTGCTTPLSNFEAGLNYKDVSDPSVVVAFPIENDPEVSLLAWTTTPWTLPSNLALCVNPNLDYVKLVDKATKKTYILCESRLEILYKKQKDPKKTAEQYEILEKFKGSTLKGTRYVPLFKYFVDHKEKGAFQVLVDDYVSDESGTGIVHQAPGFGEDDHRVCLNNKIVTVEDIPCPLDANGCFLSNITEFAGKYIKDAEKEIVAAIKKEGRLVSAGSIVHSYPFCWRSETPLIYRTIPSWFVAVEKIKDRLLETNKQSRWVPDFVQEKRFHNWLSEARDWAVSRNRYWGTPIPIWKNDEGEIVCIRSVEHLEQKSGKKVTDLHRESVDDIEIPSEKGGSPLKRVEEVFDCWFESGSMPYAQVHYPFENEELFKKSFPADFIAEGLDQTRGWFYTLMVLSTALFDQPAFKNVIVNGLVLASDGKKMSKRLKNYPDPTEVVNRTGADALRLYLINSPVVRAEPLKFVEKGVKDVIKDLFLPWYNAYRFLVQNTLQYERTERTTFAPDVKVALKSNNVMDKWILTSCQSLIKFVRKEMEGYRLYTVMPRLVKFIDQLTNWYIRFNRKRLRGSYGQDEALMAINTLFHVIYAMIRLMAPFTPFLTEYIYQNLKKALPAEERQDSVHYLMIPEPLEEAINTDIETTVARMQAVIELGRAARDRRKLPVKFPLKELLVVSKNEQLLEALRSCKNYIVEELNLRDVVLTSDEASFVAVKASADMKALGRRLKGDAKNVSVAIDKLTNDEIRSFLANPSSITFPGGHVLALEDLQVTRIFSGDQSRYEASWDNDVLVVLSIEVDEQLKAEGTARQVVNRVQKLRKKVGLQPENPVKIFYTVSKAQSAASAVLEAQKEAISTALGASFEALGSQAATSEVDTFEVLDDPSVSVYLLRL
eukprot:TRINITY_DN3331_c0_g1_i2.p1 TRINITY_DN3331_c0_g1~~TRINITY_DN3331_c0_g1_i2.p1  ORF type:complete len:1070 (-),score=302.88 TRINITY_DN3331_c0_g1_i2:3045-6254(-)